MTWILRLQPHLKFIDGRVSHDPRRPRRAGWAVSDAWAARWPGSRPGRLRCSGNHDVGWWCGDPQRCLSDVTALSSLWRLARDSESDMELFTLVGLYWINKGR